MLFLFFLVILLASVYSFQSFHVDQWPSDPMSNLVPCLLNPIVLLFIFPASLVEVRSISGSEE